MKYPIGKSSIPSIGISFLSDNADISFENLPNELGADQYYTLVVTPGECRKFGFVPLCCSYTLDEYTITVVDCDTDAAIANVDVEIENTVTGDITNTQTDANGVLLLEDFPSGTYVITFVVAGYVQRTFTVTVVPGTIARTFCLDSI